MLSNFSFFRVVKRGREYSIWLDNISTSRQAMSDGAVQTERLQAATAGYLTPPAYTIMFDEIYERKHKKTQKTHLKRVSTELSVRSERKSPVKSVKIARINRVNTQRNRTHI